MAGWVQGLPVWRAAVGSDSNDVKIVQSDFSLDP